MNGCIILPESFSLQQRTLHELAKKSWSNLLLRDEDCVFILRETEKLIAHRETVLNNLPQTLSELPKPLKSKLFNAIFRLQQGYSEAFAWEAKCKPALPFTIFDPEIAVDYHVDKFIDSRGHFNEMEWAKRFIDDESQIVHNRFVLACFYCLDTKIESLWHTMKNNKQLPRLTDVTSEYKDHNLVVIWAYQLENKFDELMEGNSLYVNGFYLGGLFDAIVEGHEYAARFFWNRLSENEKNYFHQNLELSLLANAAEGNHAGLVNFIYSLFNEEQKKELFSWITIDISLTSILCCLLHSHYYESVNKDIIEPSSCIPTEIYKLILKYLSFEIAELQIPHHKLIFVGLWDILTQQQRREVLAGNSYMVMNFVKIKDMDLLKMIIQSMTPYERDMMLLDDWLKAGISALDDFSFAGNYQELRRYFLFFFVQYSPRTKECNLRSDASVIFDKFIKGEDFINFTEKIPALEDKALNKFIDQFKDSLESPHLLLEEIEENFPYRFKDCDILS